MRENDTLPNLIFGIEKVNNVPFDTSELKRRYKTKLSRFSKGILERDRWTCQFCGRVGTSDSYMIAHRIKPISERPDLMFDPKNILTACPDCHKRLIRERYQKY